MAKFTLDFRFIEFEGELSALEHLRDVLERELPEMVEREQSRLLLELKEKGWDSDEAERAIVSQTMNSLRDDILPRVVRGSVLVSVWAAYESAVIAMAENVRAERALDLEMDEIRGGFLVRAKKYF